VERLLPWNCACAARRAKDLDFSRVVPIGGQLLDLAADDV